jgi:glycosyltransferase involved in cell wall biosynthesis
MLIILPAHLQVSGVTTWAVRAIRGLRERSIPAGLIVHTAKGESVPAFLAPYVLGVVENAPPINQLNGNLDDLIPVYLRAIKAMHAITNRPVLVSPNLHGDCHGAIAIISQQHPELIRSVCWIHSDNEYELAVARRYEPILHGFLPVSKELESFTRRSIPSRKSDIFHLPHCVEIEPACSVREPMSDRRINIIYAGRLDEHQKRISTLPHLARQLNERAIDFDFRIVGDGPEMDSLTHATQSIPNVHIVGPVPLDEMSDHLGWADVWVLPSRFEGQSVAMLEALASGCLPIVTTVRSGASDAIIDGPLEKQTGLCIDADWDTPVEIIAERMCDAIEHAQSLDTQTIARNAHALIRERHSIDLHINLIESLIAHAVAQPDRTWPKHLRASYSAKPNELDGSTPPDAAHRITKALESLAGKKTLIYCSGQHTKDVGSSINNSPANIIGIIDDDPNKRGSELLGYPIYTPEMIPTLGATDLVISSWIYEDTIWSKHEAIESLGIRVHRLYPPEPADPSIDSVTAFQC